MGPRREGLLEHWCSVWQEALLDETLNPVSRFANPREVRNSRAIPVRTQLYEICAMFVSPLGNWVSPLPAVAAAYRVRFQNDAVGIASFRDGTPCVDVCKKTARCPHADCQAVARGIALEPAGIFRRNDRGNNCFVDRPLLSWCRLCVIDRLSERNAIRGSWFHLLRLGVASRSEVRLAAQGREGAGD